MKTQNKVLIFGTFDILHPGHLKLLNFAAKQGSVTVALTPDKLCEVYKGEKPVSNYDVRKIRLESLNLIDKVLPADNKPNTYNIISEVKPNVIVLGYDQLSLKKNISKRLDELRSTARIIVAPSYRANLYKSSKLKQASLLLA